MAPIGPARFSKRTGSVRTFGGSFLADPPGAATAGAPSPIEQSIASRALRMVQSSAKVHDSPSRRSVRGADASRPVSSLRVGNGRAAEVARVQVGSGARDAVGRVPMSHIARKPARTFTLSDRARAGYGT